jgi:hypothetical protein
MAAPWPAGLPPRSDNFFRQAIKLDSPVNPFVSQLYNSNMFRSFVSLGTVPDVDENTIIAAYTKQVEDDPANAVFYLECLQDIGASTQSRKIKDFTEEQRAKGLFTRFDLQRAYRTLEIDLPEEIDDDGVFAVFQSRCADAPERDAEFQSALSVIQHFRDDTIRVASRDNKKGMIGFRNN